MPVVRVADPPAFVNNKQCWHPAQLQQVDLLPVLVGNRVTRVRQAPERQVLTFPVSLEGYSIVGTDRQNDRVTRGEGREIIPQAGEMCATIWSEKPAQEDEHDILLAPEA
jgi:hypothetical protein